MSKLKNSLILIFLIFSVLSLSGCTNTSKENLENYYYAMAIGIDYSKEANINLSIQIAANSSQDSSSGESSQSTSSNIYTVPCNSIDSGISIFNNYLSKKINLSHCSAIIFSEEVAKSGVRDFINSLGNNPEIRPTCNIIVSSEQAISALEKISNSNEKFSSKFYEFIKNSAKYTGYSINPELSEFFYCLNMETCPAIATYATVTEEAIQNTGLSIFKDDKFITNLTVLDSISYSLLADRLECATITIKNPTIQYGLIDIQVKPVRKTSLSCKLINDYPYIQVDLAMEYSILSTTNNIDISNIKENKLLESTINQYIQEMILSFLYKAYHKYDLDLCNFRNEFSSNYLTLEDFDKIHWNEILKDSYFNVTINGKITDGGLFLNR